MPRRRGDLRRWSKWRLDVYVAVFSRPPLCWWFEISLAEVKNELLARELPSIADQSGGYLVEWVLGIQ